MGGGGSGPGRGGEAVETLEPVPATGPSASLANACILPEEVVPTLLVSQSAGAAASPCPPDPSLQPGAGWGGAAAVAETEVEDPGGGGAGGGAPSVRESGNAASAPSTGGTTASASSSAAVPRPPRPAAGPGAGGGGGTEEEEFVVVTAQQPISAWARRGPTPRAAASGFCGNLARIAGTLEQLAKKWLQDSPLEALALLCRALGLLEKALNISLVEEEASETLRKAFLRMLEAAEAAAQQVHAASQLSGSSESLRPPARPNSILFEHAVQQAKDAAVALSKGHEVGGWETPCHERLTLALLLLDLLGSEADGEDVATIQSYTAPIARLIGGIERLGRHSCTGVV